MRQIPVITLCLFTVLIQGCGGASSQRVEQRERDARLARQYVFEGIEAYRSGDDNAAQSALENAVETDAFSGIAHNNLGLVYYRQGKLYRAAQQFQLAAKLLPYNPEPANNLGLVLESAGRLDESVGQFEQAMSLQPDNPQFIGNLARARLRRGDRGEQTRELIDQLVLKDHRPEWNQWAKRQQTMMIEKPTTTKP